MNENAELEKEKKKRLYDNFLDDIEPLKPYFDDPAVTDIFIVASGEIIIKRFAQGKLFTGIYIPAAKVKGIILSAATLLDKQIDPVNGIPKLEAVIPPPYSARVTGILPPWASEPEITFRKPPTKVFPLEDYVEKKRLGPREYDIICEYIKKRKNILVGGSTGSGKTTFVNAVIKKMTEYTPDDRFYIIEDVPELRCEARDKTMINAPPSHAVEAVRTALRWTPDRIIFGELRYGEVADELLKAWNTGHTGNVTTIHADNCSSMLARVEDLLREVIKGSIPKLSRTIHLCVHLSPTPNGPVVDETLPVSEGDTDTFIELLRKNNMV